MGRLRALLVVVGMLVASVASVAPAAAATPVDYITIDGADSASGAREDWPVYCQTSCPFVMQGVYRVEDPFCGTSSQKFRIVFYAAPNFEGDRVVLCRPQRNFCDVPLHRLPTNVGCFVLCCNFLQDAASSVWVQDINGSGCARVFEDINFGTGHSEGWLTRGLYGHMTDIPGSGIGDDEASSVKFVYAGSCP